MSFVLVGALGAVAQGAPLTTQDVDIVHARTPENLDRLMTALKKLNARYRGRALANPLVLERRALTTTGHSSLMTDLGPLDCLGAMEGGRDYDVLIPLSVDAQLDSQKLRVLGLETIVAIKRASKHPKDRLALLVLEATLRLGGLSRRATRTGPSEILAWREMCGARRSVHYWGRALNTRNRRRSDGNRTSAPAPRAISNSVCVAAGAEADRNVR